MYYEYRKNTTRQNNYEMYNFLKTFGDEPVYI